MGRRIYFHPCWRRCAFGWIWAKQARQRVARKRARAGAIVAVVYRTSCPSIPDSSPPPPHRLLLLRLRLLTWATSAGTCLRAGARAAQVHLAVGQAGGRGGCCQRSGALKRLGRGPTRAIPRRVVRNNRCYSRLEASRKQLRHSLVRSVGWERQAQRSSSDLSVTHVPTDVGDSLATHQQRRRRRRRPTTEPRDCLLLSTASIISTRSPASSAVVVGFNISLNRVKGITIPSKHIDLIAGLLLRR